MLSANNNKILLASLFVSISAHAVALYLLQPTSTRFSLVEPGQIQINVVALSAKITDKNKFTDNGHFLKKNKSAPSPVNHTTKSIWKVASNDAPQENGNENLTKENKLVNNTTSKLTVQLRGKIKTALQKHLTYPPIARRRGWQGTVTIYVTVMSNGDLQQVKIGKSSGYALLDKSAIAALQKVGRLNELRPLLQGKTIPIELPIKYLLKDPGYNTPSV
ncbi:MAG: energy transducer TonB [Acidiferrobacterales bacterium]